MCVEFYPHLVLFLFFCIYREKRKYAIALVFLGDKIFVFSNFPTLVRSLEVELAVFVFDEWGW